jgi:hypothetical protein
LIGEACAFWLSDRFPFLVQCCCRWPRLTVNGKLHPPATVAPSRSSLVCFIATPMAADHPDSRHVSAEGQFLCRFSCRGRYLLHELRVNRARGRGNCRRLHDFGLRRGVCRTAGQPCRYAWDKGSGVNTGRERSTLVLVVEVGSSVRSQDESLRLKRASERLPDTRQFARAIC